jgi:predicted nucleotide-binding protein
MNLRQKIYGIRMTDYEGSIIKGQPRPRPRIPTLTTNAEIFVDEWIEEKETLYDLQKNNTQNEMNNKDGKEVFIVHGHDEAFKNEVALFISDLNLSYVILHKKANLGNTLIEKLEKETDNIAFAIILYTACDVGRSKRKSKGLKNRARQNVVFEHGYLIAKLGRGKVCLLQKGNIELPSDISGVVYSRSSSNWKEDLRIELKAVGLIN